MTPFPTSFQASDLILKRQSDQDEQEVLKQKVNYILSARVFQEHMTPASAGPHTWKEWDGQMNRQMDK